MKFRDFYEAVATLVIIRVPGVVRGSPHPSDASFRYAGRTVALSRPGPNEPLTLVFGYLQDARESRRQTYTAPLQAIIPNVAEAIVSHLAAKT